MGWAFRWDTIWGGMTAVADLSNGVLMVVHTEETHALGIRMTATARSTAARATALATVVKLMAPLAVSVETTMAPLHHDLVLGLHPRRTTPLIAMEATRGMGLLVRSEWSCFYKL